MGQNQRKLDWCEGFLGGKLQIDIPNQSVNCSTVRTTLARGGCENVSGKWSRGNVFCLGNCSVADNRIKSPFIMKLYVGNFSFDMTERTLRELFEPFGTVSEVKLIMDRETGQSRGFGFVTMGNVSEGNAAIKGLDGKDKGGRKLKVNEARPKDDRGARPSPGSRR